MMDDELDEIQTGKARRALMTARLAAKMGAGLLRKKMGINSSASSAQETNAEVIGLVKEIGALKGVLMKFGQMASYLPGSLPEDAQKALTQLQAHSVSLPYEKVAEVITRELGAPPEECFERFDREPLAAASIGQVHRARHLGAEVVVKVQYPGIETAIGHDVATLGLLTKLGTFGLATDGKELALELRDRMLEECDYRLEARNQTVFAEMLRGDPEAHIPRVFDERSARRVITTAFAPGQEFNRFAKTAPQESRDRAGEVIFRTCFTQIMQRCVYNADPHPGNYLFDPDGKVTFLDYGSVRWFEPEMIDAWKGVARVVMRGDRDGFVAAFSRLGFVTSPSKFDWDHQWQAMRHLYTPFLQSNRFTFTADFIRETYDRLLFKNPNLLRTRIPPEWLMLNRLQWGLNAVLAQLGSAGRWAELWHAAIDSPTDPMSRTEPIVDLEASGARRSA